MITQGPGNCILTLQIKSTIFFTLEFNLDDVVFESTSNVIYFL